jgi:hypothetical protein
MSGPIVRKYGFPNFEKIFGERPLLHGEPAPVEEKPKKAAKSAAKKPAVKKKKADDQPAE